MQLVVKRNAQRKPISQLSAERINHAKERIAAYAKQKRAAAKRDELQGRLNKANTLFSAGRYEEAKDVYGKIMDINRRRTSHSRFSEPEIRPVREKIARCSGEVRGKKSKQGAQDLLSEADSLFKEKKFSEAKRLYSLAKRRMRENISTYKLSAAEIKYASRKRRECTRQLRAAGVKDELLKTVNTAKALFFNQRYSEAIVMNRLILERNRNVNSWHCESVNRYD